MLHGDLLPPTEHLAIASATPLPPTVSLESILVQLWHIHSLSPR